MSKHQLTVISKQPSNLGLPDSYQIVRWCCRCGAIVTDLDIDGNTHPGEIMGMMLPQSELKEKTCK